MKKYFLSLVCLFCVAFAFAQPPVGDANVGDVYGAKVSAKKAKPIADVAASLEGNEPMNAKVIGKVVDVCSKKGCWATVELANGETAMIKMKDYGFFLPTSVKGKMVVLDGQIQKVVTPVAELKHFAEDAKKSQAEIDAITQPKEEISFTAKGIKVVK